ncbi:unnamed protein product [Symbiodinium necroappetens]|uniref:Malic enzyme NAD-binding domain-containing protein n=1 Tax=Symbiodinium necroappetens TaxID=1628268 RepID=A0A812JL71_9DINO|nr:unnamed protein product [Symbiodinium necroappetens]
MLEVQKNKPGGGGRPIIFALSNPMTQAELTAADCYKFSDGQAIFGSGTRFPPVDFNGRTRIPGQVNNFFIFPGMSFGAYWCEAKKIPDKWFMVAAITVAQSLDDKDLEAESVLPHPSRIQQVSHNVAVKVAMAAQRDGLAQHQLGDDITGVSTALKVRRWAPLRVPEGVKVMDICLGSLVTPRNIKDVVALLKKEVIKTLGYEASNTEGNLEYRRLLIRALHACTGQYPDQAQSVMFLLMDFLTESDQMTATEVVMFLRELIANYTEMRLPILQRLAECIADVSQSRVLRGCLWLFGEYCEDEALIENVIQGVLAAVRPLPLVLEDASKDKKDSSNSEKKQQEKKPPKITTKTVVLADGTYGTQNVYEGGEGEEEEAPEEKAKTESKKTAFRTLLLGGDFLLSAMVGVSMTKLCMKLKKLPVGVRNEVLLVIANLFKLVKQHACGGEKCDSAVRLSQCIRAFAVLGNSQLSDSQRAAAQLVQGDWTSNHGRDQLAKVLELAAQNSEWALGQEEEVQEKSVGPDECVMFRQLRERKGGIGPTGAMDDDEDFSAARGAFLAQAAADGALFAERLAKVQQMTGLADPVYVEAFLQVHSFDLMLELLVVNRTSETLQNVLIELSTQGDLKIVDRPSAVTLAAGQQMTLHASIKVASTETGIIFGYVTFEKKSAADKECSVLNELHVDILDYIERSWINELAFRTMWSEFEWENKVNINTSITEVGTFLEHIMRNTNMSIVGRSYKKGGDNKTQKKGKLTAEDVQEMLRDAVGIKKLIDTSSFVAVNLYAKSIFGEDALANISIEKLPDGKLTGSCRIRSRTQGIALSLGDRITIVQRGVQAFALMEETRMSIPAGVQKMTSRHQRFVPVGPAEPGTGS